MFLVTGATGSLGRRIVRRLRQENSPVRAFVRLLSDYRELEDRGAQIAIGDLTDERDIARAVRGVDYLISAHGSGDDTVALDYRANIELIDRSKESGVKHFVYISVLGAERYGEDAPVFRAKREVEKYLIASGLPHTILRPSGFADDLLPLAERFRDTGIYLLVGEADHRSSIISTDDLAALAVDSVRIEAARDRTFSVGGPEVLTRGDIPRIFSEIFQKEPLVLNPPLFVFDGLRTGIGLLNPRLQRSLGTLRTLLANEFFLTREEVAALETIYHRQLETVESFLRRYLT